MTTHKPSRIIKITKRLMRFIPTIILLLSCAAISAGTSAEQKALEKFETLKTEFIDDLWELNPGWALAVGNYDYADRLTINDDAYREMRDQFSANYQNRLNAIAAGDLPPLEQIDYRLIDNYLQSLIWNRDEFQAERWDPSRYNVARSVSQVLNGRYAPLEERLSSLYHMLELVPSYYEAAAGVLNTPTRPHTELAVEQNRGTIGVLDGALRDSLALLMNSDARVGDQEWFDSFNARIDHAIASVEAYIGMLNEEWLDSDDASFRDFRIGSALYSRKFQFDNVSYYNADEVYRQAVQRKEELHEEMMERSAGLWEKYHPGREMPEDLARVQMVLDEIARDHVHRDSLVPAIKAQIPELEAFVMENELLTLDPGKPLVVRETPEYMRGFSIASISAPGPYDSGGDTYYNVSPIDHMTDEEAESFLREYNNYTLQILNIHEAVPGHYTQLVYANRSPSIIKSILRNTAMIEGWAVYTEQMMLEEGYGDYKLELWLMYAKWHLRVVTNTILDYRIHNEAYRYSRDEGLDLLMNRAFQERAEAEGKWRRATLSQVQLTSYFTGYTEIWNLREEWKEQEGDDFDLREFHETFLSFGSSPVKYIRELMLLH